MKHFKAPWGPALWTGSVFTVVIFVAIACLAPLSTSRLPLLLLLLLLLTFLALFAVTGYEITPEALVIERLGWVTRIPHQGLRSAEFQPKAMRRSIRLWGNGGGFSITGYYWNKSLGRYRAFVTDLNRTVVLCFDDRRIVVSPDAPEEFVQALAPYIGAV